MTVIDVLAATGTAYLVLSYLASKLFPRFEVISATDPRYVATVCAHVRRRPHEPEFSVGDGSDYESRCCACGQVLREPPNV